MRTFAFIRHRLSLTTNLMLISGLALIPTVHAKDCGRHGTVFEIAEVSLLQVIQDRLKAAQGLGKLEALQDQVKERIIIGIENPAAVEGVKRTVQKIGRAHV